MTIWVLTIILAGNPQPLVDPNVYRSLADCRAEGIRQAQDYQAGGVRARYECESQIVPKEAR